MTPHHVQLCSAFLPVPSSCRWSRSMERAALWGLWGLFSCSTSGWYTAECAGKNHRACSYACLPCRACVIQRPAACAPECDRDSRHCFFFIAQCTCYTTRCIRDCCNAYSGDLFCSPFRLLHQTSLSAATCPQTKPMLQVR
jgi:hypothetical protein